MSWIIKIIEESPESPEQDREIYSQRIESLDLPAVMAAVNKKKRVRKPKEEKEK